MLTKHTASQKIYVSKSTIPDAGRGVFAKQDIGKNEIIESCPVIVLSREELFIAAPTILSNYYFNWSEKKFSVAIVLGYGSLYNHAKKPDADFTPDIPRKTMVFTALRDITKGEEIFICYSPRVRKNTQEMQ